MTTKASIVAAVKLVDRHRVSTIRRFTFSGKPSTVIIWGQTAVGTSSFAFIFTDWHRNRGCCKVCITMIGFLGMAG